MFSFIVTQDSLSYLVLCRQKSCQKVYNGVRYYFRDGFYFSMNVTICKEMRMGMAHRLPHHDGKCRALHGHTYVVRVYVTGEVQPVSEDNPQSGMVVDFGVVKDFLKMVEARMDHQFGNETIDPYPTAERLVLAIAEMVYKELQPRLPCSARASRVRVYEEYVAPQAFAEVEL